MESRWKRSSNNSSFSARSRERANVPGHQLANGRNRGQVPDRRLANGRKNELVLSWSQATSRSCVNLFIREPYHYGPEQIANKTFVKMMAELGYDVELTYMKKAAE